MVLQDQVPRVARMLEGLVPQEEVDAVAADLAELAGLEAVAVVSAAAPVGKAPAETGAVHTMAGSPASETGGARNSP